MLTDLVLTGHLYTLSGVVGGLVLAVVLTATGRDRTSAREAARLVIIRLPLVFASSVAFGLVLLVLGSPGTKHLGGVEIPGWIAIAVFLLVGHVGLLVAARHLERNRPWLWSAGMALLVVFAVGLLHSSEPVGGYGPSLQSPALSRELDLGMVLRLGFLTAVGLTVAGASLAVIARRPAAVHVAELLVSRGSLAAIVGVVAQGWLGSRILESEGGLTVVAQLHSAGFWSWLIAASGVAVLAGVELAASARVPALVVRALLGSTLAATAAIVAVRGSLEGASRLAAGGLPFGSRSGPEIVGFVVAALILGSLLAGPRRLSR